MTGRRVIAGLVAGALVATVAAVAPAVGATEQTVKLAKRQPPMRRQAGSFTPAAADPRLAALLAQGGIDDAGFRFTPAETSRTRAVTVAVKARSNRAPLTQTAAASTGLAPIAYNLGAKVGWKRLAISGDVSRVDLGVQPGSREAADLAVSYAANRFTGQVKAAADRPLANLTQLDNRRSYSLDLGGSYSLTRNLDVTAGVRYRMDRERLPRIEDDRRDSQAVYVGTAFRF